MEDSYSTPKQLMIGGHPISAPVSNSPMEHDPRPLGVITCVPDYDSMDCVIYVGSDIRNDLLQRHRNGAPMPNEIELSVAGAEYKQTEWHWDARQLPELAVISFAFQTTTRST
ncbi:MAG: hypothetical protein KJZ83_00120 [Burkholderiaceae bacterium]|nr:hypothetical protein [Burkholderiaceae bacterium]